MFNVLNILLKISLVLFMVGNLFDMGLELKIGDAITGIKDKLFLSYSLLWGFVLCPLLGVALTKILPLSEPYALGLILLAMAPCAPFLPMMVSKAKGDLGYAAAFMLVASVVTVVYMPLFVPVLAKGLTASPWTIAKPLLLFLLVPLAIGMVFRRRSLDKAAAWHTVVKKVTMIDTVLMLVLCIVVYGKGFLNAVGTFAIGAQILFFLIGTAASYKLSFGLSQSRRSVLALGMATRNLGAAFAPLFAIHGMDPRAIVMVALGVPMQTLASVLAARWFARQSTQGEQP